MIICNTSVMMRNTKRNDFSFDLKKKD